MRIAPLFLAVLLLPSSHVRAVEEASTSVPIASSAIGGRVIAEIPGDVLHPSFSPDGMTLAYAKVTFVKNVERDEVYLYSVESKTSVRLVSSKTAAKFETYSAYIVDLEWVGTRRLRVEIADGDVDSTSVTYDTVSRKVVSAHPEPGGDEIGSGSYDWLPADVKAERDRALRLFPDIAAADLNASLASTGFVTPDGRLVFQGRGGASGNGIWLIDTTKRSRTRLAPTVAGADGSMLGGTYAGSSVLLVIQSSRNAHVAHFEADGTARVIGTLDQLESPPSFEVVQRSPGRVAFLLRSFRGGQVGDNPLFVFDGTRLVRSSDYSQLAGASIDQNARRVAFCIWKADETRTIVVRELAGPR